MRKKVSVSDEFAEPQDEITTEVDEETLEEADSPEGTEVVAAAEVAESAEDAESAESTVDSVADAASEEDPAEAFKRGLRQQFGDWYVIHSYAGYENRVKVNLETRIQTLNMEDYIFEIQVPMEEVREIKNGQPKIVRRVRMPGYVLVRMDLTDDSWGAVRHTPGVTGFVCCGQGEPDRRRLRDRRDGHRQGRSVRDHACHDFRDQPRGPKAQGVGVDLRPRNAGRTLLLPGRQALSEGTS